MSATVASARHSLKPCVCNWEAYGVNNVLEKLHLTRSPFFIPDDVLAGDAGFFSRELSKEDHEAFELYLTDLGRALEFDIPDAVAVVNRSTQKNKYSVKYQYAGYSSDPQYQAQFELRKKVFDDLNNSYMKLSAQAVLYSQSDKEEIRLLAKHCHWGMDFVSETANMLMNPTEMYDPAFRSLFAAFARLSGILLRDGACEAPRMFRVFGVDAKSQPDMRAYIPVDDEHWWRHKPSAAGTRGPPANLPVSAVVKVKVSPPEERSGDVLKETEAALGQVVGEMMAELLSSRPVADTNRLSMLGILVLSTKVYIIKLNVPQALMEMYKDKASSSDDNNDYAGNVAISQGFDFLKVKSRQKLLRILHMIGTISSS